MEKFDSGEISHTLSKISLQRKVHSEGRHAPYEVHPSWKGNARSRFLIQKLSNTEQSLRTVLQAICDVDANDSFAFEVAKIKILDHSQLAYPGAEITLQALFGATKTVIRMDLGFGDREDPIEHPIDLTTTSKGPLFESRISLHCYPKESIFAEKLETIVFRGGGNTRMKDFHDLYSLWSVWMF